MSWRIFSCYQTSENLSKIITEFQETILSCDATLLTIGYYIFTFIQKEQQELQLHVMDYVKASVYVLQKVTIKYTYIYLFCFYEFKKNSMTQNCNSMQTCALWSVARL